MSACCAAGIERRHADTPPCWYSLIETAKVYGVEPHAYLSQLFAELPKATTAEPFESLLPGNIRPAIPAAQ